MSEFFIIRAHVPSFGVPTSLWHYRERGELCISTEKCLVSHHDEAARFDSHSSAVIFLNTHRNYLLERFGDDSELNIMAMELIA
jgi:hypothetical protein